MNKENPDFWDYLDRLIKSSEIEIDRPKGSQHPRFRQFIHPLDYGYSNKQYPDTYYRLLKNENKTRYS